MVERQPILPTKAVLHERNDGCDPPLVDNADARAKRPESHHDGVQGVVSQDSVNVLWASSSHVSRQAAIIRIWHPAQASELALGHVTDVNPSSSCLVDPLRIPAKAAPASSYCIRTHISTGFFRRSNAAVTLPAQGAMLDIARMLRGQPKTQVGARPEWQP